MCKVHLCIVCTLLDCILNKKKCKQKTVISHAKADQKVVFGIHLRKDNLIISSEMSLHAPAIYKIISFCDSFGGQ